MDNWGITYTDKILETPDIGKLTQGKLNYELDFDFVTDMAKRMQKGKEKYKPYSWKNPTEIEDFKQGLFRHIIAVMKGEFEDDGQEFGHLSAIAVNAMMINYQLKQKKLI